MQTRTTTRPAQIRRSRANSSAVTPRSSSLKALFFSAERSRPTIVNVGIKPECRSNPKQTEDVAVEGYFDGKVPLSYSVQEFPPAFPIPLPYELVLFFVKSRKQRVSKCVMDISTGRCLWFGNIIALKRAKSGKLQSIAAAERALVERIVITLTYGGTIKQ
ncbi:hypothetical protein F5887DRAFT_1072651 [Amanita rubescens]|nr:hypothetical protein F5887DRAFT_1072651 [Amanita rubescens]